MASEQAGDMQDLELLGRFQGGDAEAFAVLLRRYERPIYNFVLRSVRDPSAAQDLAQEVFMRVIHGSDGFQREAKFSTWLYTIARHLIIDHTRRMKHRRHASLDGPGADRDDGTGPKLVDRLAHTAPGAERELASSEVRERISLAVDELPDDQREVFLLRHVQNLPFAEIALVCGVPENTVKSRMRYALTRLQSALADYEEQARALG